MPEREQPSSLSQLVERQQKLSDHNVVRTDQKRELSSQLEQLDPWENIDLVLRYGRRLARLDRFFTLAQIGLSSLSRLPLII